MNMKKKTLEIFTLCEPTIFNGHKIFINTTRHRSLIQFKSVSKGVSFFPEIKCTNFTPKYHLFLVGVPVCVCLYVCVFVCTTPMTWHLNGDASKRCKALNCLIASKNATSSCLFFLFVACFGTGLVQHYTIFLFRADVDSNSNNNVFVF